MNELPLTLADVISVKVLRFDARRSLLTRNGCDILQVARRAVLEGDGDRFLLRLGEFVILRASNRMRSHCLDRQPISRWRAHQPGKQEAGK